MGKTIVTNFMAKSHTGAILSVTNFSYPHFRLCKVIDEVFGHYSLHQLPTSWLSPTRGQYYLLPTSWQWNGTNSHWVDSSFFHVSLEIISLKIFGFEYSLSASWECLSYQIVSKDIFKINKDFPRLLKTFFTPLNIGNANIFMVHANTKVSSGTNVGEE